MTDKAIISDYTYRSLESQREAFPGMPVFVLPDDLTQLFRATTRKVPDRFHVESLGVLGREEKQFREFMAGAKERKAEIVCREDSQTFVINGNCENLVKRWRDARRDGAAQVGGRISADLRRKESMVAADKIKDRWPLPSEEWPTKALLKEAGISYNTAKTLLPPRPVAQYNYRAKHKREIKEAEISAKPKEKLDFCGLYVFQIEDDIFKIGTSRNAENRLKQVSAYQKKRMKVVALFNMEIEKAMALENEVHYRLRKYRCHEYNGREIFKTSLTRINRVVKQARKYLFEVPSEE